MRDDENMSNSTSVTEDETFEERIERLIDRDFELLDALDE